MPSFEAPSSMSHKIRITAIQISTLIFLGLLVVAIARVDAADKVKFAYAAPFVNVSMLWITKEAKLFDENSVDAEVLDPSLVQKAMITGGIYVLLSGLLRTRKEITGRSWRFYRAMFETTHRVVKKRKFILRVQIFKQFSLSWDAAGRPMEPRMIALWS